VTAGVVALIFAVVVGVLLVRPIPEQGAAALQSARV